MIFCKIFCRFVMAKAQRSVKYGSEIHSKRAKRGKYCFWKEEEMSNAVATVHNG